MADGECLSLNLDDDVSHVIGSSKHKPRTSWKKYWMGHTGRIWPQKCQMFGCVNPPTVGAHVYVKRFQNNFILPTCQSCNKDPQLEYGVRWSSAKANAEVVRVKAHSNTYETDSELCCIL
jgi:hypothetical protein